MPTCATRRLITRLLIPVLASALSACALNSGDAALLGDAVRVAIGGVGADGAPGTRIPPGVPGGPDPAGGPLAPGASPSYGPGVPPSYGPGGPPSSGPGVPPSLGPGVPPSYGPGVPPSLGPGVPPSLGPGVSPSDAPVQPGETPGIDEPGTPATPWPSPVRPPSAAPLPPEPTEEPDPDAGPAAWPVPKPPAWLSLDFASVPLPAEAHGDFFEDYSGRVFTAPRADGGMWLAWNERRLRRVRFIALKSDLSPQGTAFLGPEGYHCEALAALAGDGLAMLGASQDPRGENPQEWPNLNVRTLLRFDAAGRPGPMTHLMGGQGDGPQAEWGCDIGASLATDGRHVAVYFTMFRNWAEPGEADDIHEADAFYLVGEDGNVDPERQGTWLSSHSFDPMVTRTQDGTYLTLTTGDAYPYGNQFINWGRKVKQPGDWEDFPTTVVWPRDDGWKPPERGVNGAMGDLGVFEAIGDRAYAVCATAEHPFFKSDEPRAILLLGLSHQGVRQTETWLTPAAPNQSQVWGGRVGDRLLVGWGERWREGVPMLALVDPAAGRIVGGPSPLDVGNGESPIARLTDGSVAWARVGSKDPGHVAVYRVRP